MPVIVGGAKVITLICPKNCQAKEKKEKLMVDYENHRLWNISQNI